MGTRSRRRCGPKAWSAIGGAAAPAVGDFPFGGSEASGIGREGIGYSVDQMTELKTITFNLEMQARKDFPSCRQYSTSHVALRLLPRVLQIPARAVVVAECARGPEPRFQST